MDRVGAEAGDQWSFGANRGTDLPLIITVEDVRIVIISNDPETIRIYKGAPFKMTDQNQLPGDKAYWVKVTYSL